ncbi:MAG TPA: hypothetical protein VIF12_05335 [Micavibrio sp.]
MSDEETISGRERLKLIFSSLNDPSIFDIIDRMSPQRIAETMQEVEPIIALQEKIAEHEQKIAAQAQAAKHKREIQ